MSTPILDPLADTNHEELARLVRVYTIPDFVKKASLAESIKPPHGAVTTFADPRNGRFSCHNAVSTFLSGMYFHDKVAEFHPKDRQRIQERLEHYVEYFRIKGAYDKLVKEAASMRDERALPDEAYAYVWVDPDSGRKSCHLPLQSSGEVKAAAEWLALYREQLPYEDRQKISSKILVKAAQFGTTFGESETAFLEKQAGQGICDPQAVCQMIEQRANLAVNPEYRDGILKLAETIRRAPRLTLQHDQLTKLAATIEGIDKALGLKPESYGSILQRPEDVIFSVTFTKAAKDVNSVCAMLTGNIYSHDQLKKVARDDLEAAFGTDFVREVSDGFQVNPVKLAEVAATLDRGSAEMFDGLMAEAGLRPILQKSAGHAMTDATLQKLAAAYS